MIIHEIEPKKRVIRSLLSGIHIGLFCGFVGAGGGVLLLNVIGGLDRYDAGALVINGISTKEYKDHDWDAYRNHTIGFVFQSYNLIPHQTILANAELALTIGGISRNDRWLIR